MSVSDEDVRRAAIKILQWGVEEARERDAMWDEVAMLTDNDSYDFDNLDVEDVRNRIENEIESILRTAGVNA